MTHGGKRPAGQTKAHFEAYQLEYLIHLPPAYNTKIEKWPYILFLHGAGERGNRLDVLKKHGLPKIVDARKDFPFIVVSPQCRPQTYWDADVLMSLVEENIKSYQIDTTRLYVTGLSMGGSGTWDLAIQYPDRFAAIAPVCGRSNQHIIQNICHIKHLPVWVFHGAQDNVVPIAYSREIVNALERCGGNVIFTVYPNAAHDCWTATYNNPALYDWLLQHKNTNAAIK